MAALWSCAQGKWLVRALLWGVGLVVALWLCTIWGAGTTVHNDFTQNVWLPARLVLDGVDPYFPDRASVYRALGEYSAVFPDFNSGPDFHFIYPMWVALVLAPFALMPLKVATAVWRAVSLLLLVWSVGRVLKASNPEFSSGRPAALVAVAVTVLLSVIYRGSFLNLYIGQFAMMEFALLAAIWGWLVASGGHQTMGRRRKLWGDVLSGLALAVLATKPQAVGLVVVLVGLWALSRGRWVIPASAVAWLALLLCAPAVFYPDSLRHWLMIVFGGQATSQMEVSGSVWGLSYHWLGENPDAPWQWVALLLSAMCAVLLVRYWGRDLRDRTSPVPIGLLPTVCLNSLISPYMLGYEHVLLLLPALVLIAGTGLPGTAEGGHGYRTRGRIRLALYVWMAVLPWVVLLLQTAAHRGFPVVVQTAAMLALYSIARPQWQWHGADRAVTTDNTDNNMALPSMKGVEAIGIN